MTLKLELTSTDCFTTSARDEKMNDVEKAKAEGNIAGSKIYEECYKKMILLPLPKRTESQEKKSIPSYVLRYMPKL